MTFLDYIDIYNPIIQFTIKGKKGFTNIISGIYSIITFIIIISSITLFGSDFYNRKNPQAFTENIHPDISKKNKITNENFNIAWRIQNINSETFNFTNILYPLHI